MKCRHFFLLFVFSLICVFAKDETLASPSSSFKEAQKCSIYSASFIGTRNEGQLKDTYYCISQGSGEIIKIGGNNTEPIVIGKINKVESQITLTYSGLVEYKVEGTGTFRQLVKYECGTDDFFDCSGSVSKHVIALSKTFRPYNKNKSKVLSNTFNGDEINNLVNQIYLSNQCKSALNYKIKMQTMMNNVGFYQSSDSYYDRYC